MINVKTAPWDAEEGELIQPAGKKPRPEALWMWTEATRAGGAGQPGNTDQSRGQVSRPTVGKPQQKQPWVLPAHGAGSRFGDTVGT